MVNIIRVNSETIYMHCIGKHLTQVCKKFHW